MTHSETWGAGVDNLGRYPFFTFWVSNPFFGLVCTNKRTVSAHPSNGTQRYVTRDPCTSNAVTDAYIHRSCDLYICIFFNSGTFFFFGCLHPPPHVSFWVCVAFYFLEISSHKKEKKMDRLFLLREGSMVLAFLEPAPFSHTNSNGHVHTHTRAHTRTHAHTFVS